MAMNPMQRRARNSFLVGFLVALIIMALLVFLLLYKIKGLNEAKQELESQFITVYVASEDLESGQVITLEDNFVMENVKTSLDESQVISSDDFLYIDEDGNITEEPKEMMMKVNVPSGTIVTKDMIVESGEQTTDSQRIQEFNMILLPSQLKNGDYIDIRYQLPNGQDFIVLSKKKVLGTNETSLWLKLDESEILTINSAIVEAYQLTGSKIYAIPYIEAGLQDAAIPTYVPDSEVYEQMRINPNITNEAKTELFNRYSHDADMRNNYIVPSLTPYAEQRDSLVESGFQNDAESIRAARQEFVESLEGTGDVGYER